MFNFLNLDPNIIGTLTSDVAPETGSAGAPSSSGSVASVPAVTPSSRAVGNPLTTRFVPASKCDWAAPEVLEVLNYDDWVSGEHLTRDTEDATRRARKLLMKRREWPFCPIQNRPLGVSYQSDNKSFQNRVIVVVCDYCAGKK